MSFEARCPQCVFLSRQLGQPTPCLLHVSLPGEITTSEAPAVAALADLDYDEPYTFGQLRPTVDRPGPFSLREYVRLLLLRSRVQEQRSPLDMPAAPTQVSSLSSR
jgi:hypothetical protein